MLALARARQDALGGCHDFREGGVAVEGALRYLEHRLIGPSNVVRERREESFVGVRRGFRESGGASLREGFESLTGPTQLHLHHDQSTPGTIETWIGTHGLPE